ncbi:MAG: AAA-like domain-containing protein [Cyanobacteria bacterium P01_G01_bin.39]
MSVNQQISTEEIITYQNEEEKFIYVERPPIEELCCNTLLNNGALVRIKAPRLMGKTALISKVFSDIAFQGYRTAYLNFHLANKSYFGDLDLFLKWFCISVGQNLGLENRLRDYWDEDFSTSKVDCTDYFEKYILPQIDTPLILCLDEVDRIFPYEEVASEFLGLLRAWHEQAKIRTIWKRLRLVISHSTEVYLQLDINSSPFNVGLPIELSEFTQQQVEQLVRQHEVNFKENEIKQLMDLVNGHPYLVEQAISYLKNNTNSSLLAIIKTGATESGIYRDHLRHLFRLISQHSELLKAFKKVIMDSHSVRLDSLHSYKLHSMGLINLQGNNVVSRCRLYEQYFLDKLTN